VVAHTTEVQAKAEAQAEVHTTKVLQDLINQDLVNREHTLLLQEVNREAAVVLEVVAEVVTPDPKAPVHLQEVVHANTKTYYHEKDNIFNPNHCQSLICPCPDSR